MYNREVESERDAQRRGQSMQEEEGKEEGDNEDAIWEDWCKSNSYLNNMNMSLKKGLLYYITNK